MKKFILSLLAVLVVNIHCLAQSITYNHDESFMQQFLFTETGAGSLTPDLYYDLFHKSYRNNYMGQGKLTFRTYMMENIHKEVPYAKDLDSALVKRAEVEALNMADRQPYLDLSWAVEGQKIEKKMMTLYNSIQDISIYGGKKETSDMFQLKYDMYKQAIESIRESYMPASERKEQYGAIYDDIVKEIDHVENAVLYLKCCKLCKSMKEAQKIRRANLSNIAVQAHGRWKAALMKGSGKEMHGGGGNGISAD